jgi:penicillin-binding protein 1A
VIESDDTPTAVAGRSNPAMSAETAWKMVTNMKLVVNAGTGTAARVSGVEIGGKTGTCDDFSDAWFVGYSPEVVCCVWVGNDDYKVKMRRMFGGNTPAQVFHDLMTKVYESGRYKEKKFVKPAGVKFTGFSGVTYGGGPAPMTDEEKAAAEAKKQAEAEAEGGGGASEGDEDSGFYEPWDPPSDGTEVHF